MRSACEGPAFDKDEGQRAQKALLAGYAARLERARQEGRKVVYTFVPGNLVELLHTFDLLAVYPEVAALQAAFRRQGEPSLRAAEARGFSEDVCGYVRWSVGGAQGAALEAWGSRLPEPDLLLTAFVGCFTYVKWFEALRRRYRCPVLRLHVPSLSGPAPEADSVRYVVDQLKRDVIPSLSRLSGRRFDPDRLREALVWSARAEEDFVAVLESARHDPPPIDAFFGAAYYMAPLFTAFRGTPEGASYYGALRREVEERRRRGRGPATPAGVLDRPRFRMVVEGPPPWSRFGAFWNLFARAGAVAVASTYSRVGGLYDRGFRHDAARPLESMAEYALGCYTNLHLPRRAELVASWVREYRADALVVHSVKSCKSYSAGHPRLLEELERRTGVPGVMLESDLVEDRYFSEANLRNRIEAYFERRAAALGRG